MANAAIAEELLSSDELDVLYDLSASEPEDEDDDDLDEDEDGEDGEEIHPDDMPQG